MKDQHLDQVREQAFLNGLWSSPRATEKPDTPARLAEWEAAQQLESRLESVLNGIAVPDELQARLLAIADTPAQVVTERPAANDSPFLARVLPTAAMLVLTIGMAWYYQLDRSLDLQRDLFGHVYAEEPWMPADQHYDLDDVNSHLSTVMGAHLAVNADTSKLEVTFLKDCQVARQVGTHLVMQGANGPINVIVLPSEVVTEEIPINDERFSGLVTPAAGRTLVVIGNKQEPIAEYRNLLNSSLEWEY